MARKLETHRALYLDLEMTCWPGPPPPGMQQDIIQIGVIEANLDTLSISREACYYVRPRNSTVSEYCTAFTGITEQRIRREGKPFGEVIATITRKFGPQGKSCFTWGNDAAALISACDCAAVAYPFNIIDLAFLYQLETGSRVAVSLENALLHLGLEFVGTPHDALIDARNTALLHMAMLLRTRRQIKLPKNFHETKLA